MDQHQQIICNERAIQELKEELRKLKKDINTHGSAIERFRQTLWRINLSG